MVTELLKSEIEGLSFSRLRTKEKQQVLGLKWSSEKEYIVWLSSML